ncbi:PAS domain-containing protein [Rhizobium leguminosarum bv. viciae]|nr:PAS domain-containing protein [Rhizobium leguminosarum bv. viciae]
MKPPQGSVGQQDGVDQRQTPLADLSPTPRQTWFAVVFSALLILGFAVIAPFAAKPLPLVYAFIPALDAVIFVTDLITACLLLTQFSITRSRALLALACGFLFSALMVVAHGLSFPGTLSTTGSFPRSPDAYAVNFRFYLYWHVGIPAAVFAYVWLEEKDRTKKVVHVPMALLSIGGVAAVLLLASCVGWLAVSGRSILPFTLAYSGDTRLWPTSVTIMLCVAALCVLWIFRRSALDQWLMIVMLAMIIELAVTAAIGGRSWRTNAASQQYGATLGVYTGRAFSLVTSTMVLIGLLAETTRLYGRVAYANMLAGAVKASQTLSSEIELRKLIEQLMTVALKNSGADRGLLIRSSAEDYVVQAQARAIDDHIEVICGEELTTTVAFPETIIRFVVLTHESVVLDDASEPNMFSTDDYLREQQSRSILCLPLIKQRELTGILLLENTAMSHAFSAARIAVLELLAAQASISLENARLYADLELQVGLLQQLPVSAWTLNPDGTPDFVNQVWLDFSGQTLEFIRSHPNAWMTAVHPEDREMAIKAFWEGVHSGHGFAFETRILRAEDGIYRRHLQQAVSLRDAEGKVLRFVGATTDIDDQKRAEETLRQTQSELAHVARVATLNAMTASIAHEVSQPLSGILVNARTSLRMLATEPPNVAGAVETAQRTIRDANRASEVLQRLREMFLNKEPVVELVDLNDAVREVIAIAGGELTRRSARLQTELADGLPRLSANRVQLQQVILNLLLNAADAMDGIDDRSRSLLVRTELESAGFARLEVRDAGVGFDPASVGRLFEPFHSTKPNGMGIGLAICRTIIESHKGRLWASPNDGPGATFSFSIPVPVELTLPR